jgi:biopolymer transport protein ExbD
MADSDSAGAISLVEEEESPLNSTINTTPLVDIMLVLLIIFLITVPVVVGTVEVQLPEERNRIVQTRPENIYLSVDTQGNVYWGTRLIPTEEELFSRLSQAAQLNPQPEVHLSGDTGTEYLNVGKVVETVQRAGILRIAFITAKPPGTGP